MATPESKRKTKREHHDVHHAGRSPIDGWAVWGNKFERGMFDADVAAV